MLKAMVGLVVEVAVAMVVLVAVVWWWWCNAIWTGMVGLASGDEE